VERESKRNQWFPSVEPMDLGAQESQGNSRSQGTGPEKRESHKELQECAQGPTQGVCVCARAHTHKPRPGKTTWKDNGEQSAKFARGQFLFPPARKENLMIHGVSSKILRRVLSQ